MPDEASPRLRFIPDLLAVHAEELAYLWGRRRASLNSSALTLRDLGDLNERIEAHTQGLLVARGALCEQLGPGLAATERDEVFAAAYPLLRAGDAKLASAVAGAFEQAQAERLAGLRDAVSLAGITHTETFLQRTFEQADPSHAVAAAAALACHRKLVPTARLAALAADPDPAVASLAWQVLASLGRSDFAIEPGYVDAIKGKHPGVRDAALGAAIWRGEFWVVGVVQRLAENADAVGLGWFAAIAGADALPAMKAALTKPAEGIHRSRVAARYGHPGLLELIVEEMRSTDPLIASVAGESFTRMTGIDVAGRRVELPAKDGADAFEREFVEDVWLPEVARAEQALAQRNAAWHTGQRWCRGCEISARLTREDRQRIDLEALADFGARAALAGASVTPPPPTL